MVYAQGIITKSPRLKAAKVISPGYRDLSRDERSGRKGTDTCAHNCRAVAAGFSAGRKGEG
jgi:hypothetical protein